jgi:hypothetical protein
MILTKNVLSLDSPYNTNEYVAGQIINPELKMLPAATTVCYMSSKKETFCEESLSCLYFHSVN